MSEVLDPKRLIQRVADQTLELIAGADGVMMGLSDELNVSYICAAGHLVPNVGTNVDLDASLSGLAIRTGSVQRSDDTEDDPRVDLDACRRLAVRSSVCVPLRRGNEILGVMAVSATRPGAFSHDDVVLLARLADFVSMTVGLAGDLARVAADLHQLGQAPGEVSGQLSSETWAPEDASRFVLSVLRPDAVALMESRNRIEAVLEDPEEMTMVFQPIVDLETDAVLAVEALSRFELEPRRAPDRWFAEANEVGLGVELEMLAVAKALTDRPMLPEGVGLTINVGPQTIMCPQFAEALSGTTGQGLVVELTEHNRVEDYPGLVTTLLAFRRSGTRLAIDDTGAGYSSLSHILKLAPDFIKLDRDLVNGIDLDPVRRALTSSLVSFATESGAPVIAEGVETKDELEALRHLGIRYVQGHLVGRPSPIGAMRRAIKIQGPALPLR